MTRMGVGGSKNSVSAGMVKAVSTGSSTVATIISLLPQLNQKELKTVQAALENELDKKVDIDRDLFQLVFDMVGEKPISVSKFASSNNGALWRKNVDTFYQLEQKIIGSGSPKRSVLIALHRFLIEILVEDIRSEGIPLTLKAVCIWLGKADEFFENSFPGYLKNGLGHLVLTKLGGTT